MYVPVFSTDCGAHAHHLEIPSINLGNVASKVGYGLELQHQNTVSVLNSSFIQ